MTKFKICLTGGIASGKTHVSDKLAEKGAHVIDADILARQVVMPGSEGLRRVADCFGSEVLNFDKTLNRAALKELVFNDKEKLKTLNSILHPLIRKAFKQASALNSVPFEIWVVPLFNGQSEYLHFNRVLVVDVKKEVQVARIINRDGVNDKVAQAIMGSQPARKSRLHLATDVISNNLDFKSLNASIDLIVNLYKQLINN